VQVIPVKTVQEALSHALVDTPELSANFQHIMGKPPAAACPANDHRPCSRHPAPAAVSQGGNGEPEPAVG